MRKYWKAILMSFAVSAMGVPALAAAPSIDLTSGFQSIVTDVLSQITAILPVVLTVFGAFVAIKIGLRVFRMVTGR